MKVSAQKSGYIIPFLLLAIGFVLSGCKKEAPHAQEPNASTVSRQKPAIREQEFISDQNEVTCELEETTISELDLPENHMASFIRRMERENREDLKRGRITLNGRPFLILLGERPEREFHLYDIEKKFGPYWWGSWSLHSYHKIDETYYQFALLEEGAKLAARAYRGPLGLFRVGEGNRQIEKVECKGSLRQEGSVAVPVGTIKENYPEAVSECTVPVGNYTSYIMHVIYDNLDICISDNYHTNAQGQSRAEKQTVYGIKIREDRPYVLDFSNEPMVVFDEPPKDKTSFSRGEEITFAAVLIDPKLDIMIRGLDDTSVKVDREYKDAEGNVIGKSKVNKSLDPNVVITRADGEIVAEGVMPFG